MSGRWKMNRIGFVNFWLYDEEIFDFEDGRLLLRGQNGSGKSITTQSFIPFILDGDRTPSRLDPFGSSDRRMEFYFLGESEREEATGYLFLEFYREDTKEYRTIGIGQRARKGKAMDFWGFVILDQRRIGLDLWLYKEVGSNRIPLAKNDLKKLLGEDVPFTEVPGEYKRMVNKYIFGFRKMEQYEQFIKLLVKVRAPKLSKEFKPTKVYEILNESLQTLTDEDLRAMVDAMEKMDAIQENLQQLKRAHGEIRIIRNEYTRYNQYMLAKKGMAYLDKKNEAEDKQKQLLDQEEYKKQMQEERQEKHLRAEEIGSHLIVVETELDSLYDTDMEEVDRKLEEARRTKKSAGEQLAKWELKIEEYKSDIQQREFRLRDLNANLDMEQKTFSKRRTELEEQQEILKWEMHHKLVQSMGMEQASGITERNDELKEYKKKILEGKNVIEQYEVVQREYDQAAEQLELSRKEKEQCAAEEEAAQIQLVEDQDALIQAFYEQAENNEEWKLADTALKRIETSLKAYKSPSDSEAIREQMRLSYEENRNHLNDEKTESERALQESRQQLSEVEAELELVRSQEEIEPRRDMATEESRKAMKEAGITGIPFFKAVEFKDNLEPEVCARLEAQLQKIGILDALVVSKADQERLKVQNPWFMDAVLHVRNRGASSFDKLVVNEELSRELKDATAVILSNIYENSEMENGIYLNAEGHFRQGILKGRAEKEGEAEYVGSLARRRKKEKRISELEEKQKEIQQRIALIKEALHNLKERLECLLSEYQSAPEFKEINKTIENIRNCAWTLGQAEEHHREREKSYEECMQRKNQKYQRMLQCCKGLPYGRTTREYQTAWEAAEEYQQLLQDIKELLMRIEQRRLEIRQNVELIEQAESQMDDAFVETRRCKTECKKQDILIRKYEEYMNRPEVKEQAKRIEKLKEDQSSLRDEQSTIDKKLAVLVDRISGILDREEAQRNELQELITDETCLAKYFEEELGLKLVFNREADSLADCAKKAQQYLRESDRGRDSGELFNALYRVFQQHNGSLTTYGTTLESCFESHEGELQPGTQIQALRSRVQIASIWNGKKLYLEEFFQILRSKIEETELLIQKKDRELFEDILSQTISKQLTDRIAESRRWTQDMSKLMKNMDTSMGLTFSLDWRPRSAENDEEIDTLELEQILLRDRELLTGEDFLKVASHFRSKIRSEKIRQEEIGGMVNYMDIVRDALDYRKWFEFQMYYRRGDEQKKRLTNASFNRFSGGEKAMAMYVPLFAAVNAQYQKAEKKDYPKIIALDEAFAGVDDKNISSMFELVHILDFDYIMNSQALWGCYENVHALKIIELYRPLNSQVVTPIRYTWNGHERKLDEQQS